MALVAVCLLQCLGLLCLGGGLLGLGLLFLGVKVSASVASTSVAVSTASMVEVVAVCLLGGVVAVVASVCRCFAFTASSVSTVAVAVCHGLGVPSPCFAHGLQCLHWCTNYIY